YVGIVAGFIARGGSRMIAWWATASALSNVVHAQLYDYHRTSYTKLAINGTVSRDVPGGLAATWAGRVLRIYHAVQRRLIGLHGDVEAAIAERSHQGIVGDADRARYRACFYWPVRGWNLLGDNTRLYAIGVLAWWHHLDWFFAFNLVPMNAA